MKKKYYSAPLPFVGQKRMFAKEFKKVLEQFPDGTTFVDLFGGSGLLSHITKFEEPHSKVVYNDFDGYRLRLEHVSQTNELLSELKKILNIPIIDKEYFDSRPYLNIKGKLPTLQYGQCYGYVPALALGGKASSKNLQVVDVKSYVDIIGQAVGKFIDLSD